MTLKLNVGGSELAESKKYLAGTMRSSRAVPDIMPVSPTAATAAALLFLASSNGLVVVIFLGAIPCSLRSYKISSMAVQSMYAPSREFIKYATTPRLNI